MGDRLIWVGGEPSGPTHLVLGTPAFATPAAVADHPEAPASVVLGEVGHSEASPRRQDQVERTGGLPELGSDAAESHERVARLQDQARARPEPCSGRVSDTIAWVRGRHGARRRRLGGRRSLG